METAQMKPSIGTIHREGTQQLQSIGYPDLVIYREPYGWKVRDTRLGRQYFHGLGRNCGEVIRMVKGGLLPVPLPELHSKEEKHETI